MRGQMDGLRISTHGLVGSIPTPRTNDRRHRYGKILNYLGPVPLRGELGLLDPTSH